MPDDDEGRLDRELIELLNELRVLLPGVQITFGFLLTVTFSVRFARLDDTERGLFYLAFLLSALSAVVLTAPSSFHRLRWRQRDKEAMLRISNWFAIAGTALLAGALVCVVGLVVDIMYGTTMAIVTTVPVALLIAICWYAIPLGRAVRRGDA